MAVLNLDIVGHISEFGDTTFAKVRQILADAGKPETINLVVNSPGGSVFEGFAIFAELEQHEAEITAEVRGLAASIASVIVMAAAPGKINIHRLGRMMMHEARAGVFGTKRDAFAMAEVLESLDRGIVSAYSAHFDWSDAKIMGAMENTTWLTAEDAKKAGVVAKILGGSDAANRLDLSPLDGFDIPSDVRELYDRGAQNASGTLAARVLAYRKTHREPPRQSVPSPRLLTLVSDRLKQLQRSSA